MTATTIKNTDELTGPMEDMRPQFDHIIAFFKRYHPGSPDFVGAEVSREETAGYMLFHAAKGMGLNTSMYVLTLPALMTIFVELTEQAIEQTKNEIKQATAANDEAIFITQLVAVTKLLTIVHSMFRAVHDQLRPTREDEPREAEQPVTIN